MASPTKRRVKVVESTDSHSLNPFDNLESQMKQNPSRHHPALVSLHWLLALLIMLAMGMGTFVLKDIPNTSPEKLGALQGHMIMGFAIGALMMARFDGVEAHAGGTPRWCPWSVDRRQGLRQWPAAHDACTPDAGEQRTSAKRRQPPLPNRATGHTCGNR